MLDLLDILQGRAAQTNPADYFEKLPEAILFASSDSDLDKTDAGIPIDFEIVDPSEYHYRSLLGNIIDKDGATMTIKSCDSLNYKVGGYISTLDGELYCIISVTKDVQSASKQALRFSSVPLETDYILRLVQVENPREIL